MDQEVYMNIKENLEELYKETEIKNLINEHVLIRKDFLKKLILDYLTVNYEKDDNGYIKIKRDNLSILVTNIEVEYKMDHIDKEDYTWMILLSYRPDSSDEENYKTMLSVLKLHENEDLVIDFNIEAFLKRSFEEFFDDYIFRRLSKMIFDKKNLDEEYKLLKQLIKREFEDSYSKITMMSNNIFSLTNRVVHDLFDKYYATYNYSKEIIDWNNESERLVRIEDVSVKYRSHHIIIEITWTLLNKVNIIHYANKKFTLTLDELLKVDFTKLIDLRIFNQIDINSLIEMNNKRKLEPDDSEYYAEDNLFSTWTK